MSKYKDTSYLQSDEYRKEQQKHTTESVSDMFSKALSPAVRNATHWPTIVNNATKEAPQVPTKPKTTDKDWLDILKGHWNKFTENPLTWAAENPWKAAGGIGALLAAAGGISNASRANGNNNQSGFFTGVLNSLPLAFGIGLGTYALSKGIPHLKNLFNGKSLVDAALKHPQVANLIKQWEETTNNASRVVTELTDLKAGLTDAVAAKKDGNSSGKIYTIDKDRGIMLSDGKLWKYDPEKGSYADITPGWTKLFL